MEKLTKKTKERLVGRDQTILEDSHVYYSKISWQKKTMIRTHAEGQKYEAKHRHYCKSHISLHRCRHLIRLKNSGGEQQQRSKQILALRSNVDRWPSMRDALGNWRNSRCEEWRPQQQIRQNIMRSFFMELVYLSGNFRKASCSHSCIFSISFI